ncbi:MULTISPECIES: SDR family oxidoreductase [Halorussus]|uniref:SDR family oxidoreductase n=1 Tax=Halorussus TaxID=1070314 RepID=UPI000E20E5BC|nr:MULTISPECIES: SDR family oxidoreductase [Halorussus]NHN61444.1 NAD-dependent epimerase/dehydratase family protein [Halorussus sp. JP-T4]
MADDADSAASASSVPNVRDSSVFLTGFPGFLGSELVARLLDRYPEDVPIRCLVQPKYRDLAEKRARGIERPGDEGDAGRIELHDGDITESDLGLGDDYDDLQRDAVEVYHLAAAYDLGVSREVGTAVNVEGTRNVLDFAEGSPDLRRFQYVSTCYVSGRHDGVFTHRDLDVGQSFNNHYEETKFRAEVEVQERMAEGLPATVYRPAIAVGDSETGRTQKYDGPYYLLTLLRRQADLLPGVGDRVGVVPTFGDPRDYEVNVVPRDFVVDAIDHLSAREDSEGEVYQLCDPSPPTVAELLRAFERATDRRILRVPLPEDAVGVARRSLEAAPALADALGVEPAVLDYFVHPTSYTSQNAIRDLRGSGVACPPFGSYVEALVRFARRHPDVSSDAMV